MDKLQAYQQARLSRDRRFDGRFFIAVKTTRIFCRSICPASLPLEKNVEYFELAQQAMQHGYRPCLRCRPDSAPHSHAWQGVTTTVTRATQLLHANHQLSITEIADKLGIGERYFRELFKAQLGISPKQFQLFDQILFAKRLLHQSNLSVEQVAQSCGFNQSRRLQVQMKKVTGLSPSQIRQQKHMISQDILLNLACRAPYNWSQLRDFLALRAIASIEQIDEYSYARYFQFAQHYGYFKATFDPTEQQFALQIQLDNIRLLPAVLRNIERVLDVNADTDSIQQQLIEAGVPADKVTQGLRLPGVWDTFEAGCRAILGQQISVKAAINLLNQLVEELGEQQSGQGYFPTAQVIADADLSFLRMPQSRQRTLQEFARWHLANPGGNIADWQTIKGIGPWTIAYAKMRGLSDPDVWLNSDLVVKNQLLRYAIKAQSAQPWRSYLTLQLWRLA